MRVQSSRAFALGVGLSAVMVLLWSPCLAVPLSQVPAVALGDGPSVIVEYDHELQPIRKYVGLRRPSDITPLTDGGLLLVDEGTHEVIVVDPAGVVQWRGQVGPGAVRARPRPGGGLLVTSIEDVIALRPDRSIEWQQHVAGIRTAAPLGNGNFLAARNAEGQGWLVELTPSGTEVWRSASRGHVDASGRWVDSDTPNFFHSTWPVDVDPSDRALATDFDGTAILVFAADHSVQQRLPGTMHANDARFGPAGELVVTATETNQVWVISPNGEKKVLEPPLRPTCANITRAGTLLVGLTWEPEPAVMNATAARSASPKLFPWRQRMVPVTTAGLLVAVGVALAVRRGDIRRWRQGAWWRTACRSDRSDPGSSPPRETRVAGPRYRVSLAVAGILAVVAGSYLAWRGIGTIVSARDLTAGWWTFAAGSVLAGTALRLLNALAGTTPTLTTFTPSRALHPPARGDKAKVTILASLAFFGTVGSIVLSRFAPAEQATAVVLWGAAQVWLLAAAFPPVPAPQGERTSRAVWILVAVLLVAAMIMRVWELGYFPDHIHHDHSIYGEAAVRTLRGDWQSFFDRVYSVGRPWLAFCAAGFWIWGVDYPVVRMTGAVSGGLVVWGTFLLGSALFNRRVGLMAAVLATFNHVLLLFSRQAYVLEPVAPFVFSLYCVVIGLRRGSAFHWCAAGVLAGWSLMAYRASSTFPPIGVAVLAYTLVAHPRWIWQNRAGLVWMLCGTGLTYLPMFAHTAGDTEIMERASNAIVLLNPDGSLRWDASLWKYQLAHSFGAIIRYADTQPWGVGTGQPICLPYAACLFGIGLTYLLQFWRSPVTFLMLAWIGIGIFLGSATLSSPPTYYHFLAEVVPIVFVCAVALDRALAVTDRWHPIAWRMPALVAATALLLVICVSDVTAVWTAVRRPPPRDGETVLRTDIKGVTARIIAAHKTDRMYVVRSRMDLSCTDPMYRVFLTDSDISDITTALDETLPVPPVEPAAGVSFIVLPSRAGEGRTITAAYPTAFVEDWPLIQTGAIHVYRVDGQTVRKVYAAKGSGSTLSAVANGATK